MTPGPATRPWVAPVAAWVLAAVLLTTGTLHFTSPDGFRSIVPGFVGSPTFWVAASGVAELACAVGLVVPATRRLAGWACVLLFLAVYPANITMLVHAMQGDGNELISWLRLPLQIPLILWAYWIARHTRTAGAPTVTVRLGSAP